MNYLLTLAYDGTNYCGFQVQPNGRSVAAVFQDALEAVLGCRPDIKGCSRTDAGVHALGFMLNFHADTRIPAAKLPLALADADTKNAALEAMAVALIAAQDKILDANKQDVENARGRVSDVMLDRLALTPGRLTDMAKGMREVAALPDPVGRVLSRIERPNGLVIEKTAVPMGVIAIIYESRPNVTSDAAALCIKSGNVCMLRSGKEAYRSSHAIVTALKAGVESVGGDSDIVNIVEDTTHASAQVLMTADGLVDLLIPRGGKGLILSLIHI